MLRTVRSVLIVMVGTALLSPELALAARGIIVKKQAQTGGTVNGRFSGEILDDKSGTLIKFEDQALDSGRYLLPVDVNDGVEFEYDASKGTAVNINKITEVEVVSEGSLVSDFQERLWGLVRAVNESTGATAVLLSRTSDLKFALSGVMASKQSKGGESSGEILDDETGKPIPFVDQRLNNNNLPSIAPPSPVGVYDGVTFDLDPALGTAINIRKITETEVRDDGRIAIEPSGGLLRFVPAVNRSIGPLKVAIYNLTR